MTRIFIGIKIVKYWFLKGTRILELSATIRYPFLRKLSQIDFRILIGSEHALNVQVKIPISAFLVKERSSILIEII